MFFSYTLLIHLVFAFRSLLFATFSRPMSRHFLPILLQLWHREMRGVHLRRLSGQRQ